jgi:hypothetical protein
MTVWMYDASVPVFRQMLKCVVGVLEKSAEYARERDVPVEVLLESRLFPDMYPMVRQVQIVTELAHRCASRLTGKEPQEFENKEKTLDELLARIDATLRHLDEFSPEQFTGSADRIFDFRARERPITLSGKDYLLHFILPNIVFHATTAYDLMRHQGVKLGKRDFLGQINGQ